MPDYKIENGELRHGHKYVKRVWKNGKWRYYYDIEDAAKDAKKQINKTVKKIDRKLDKTADKIKDGLSERNIKKTKKKIGRELDQAGAKLKNAASNAKNKIEDKLGVDDKKRAKAAQDIVKSKNTKRNQKIAAKLTAQYASTPIGKLETAAKKGKTAYEKAKIKLTAKKRKKQANKNSSRSKNGSRSHVQ